VTEPATGLNEVTAGVVEALGRRLAEAEQDRPEEIAAP
jgi:hypothetical protein